MGYRRTRDCADEQALFEIGRCRFFNYFSPQLRIFNILPDMNYDYMTGDCTFTADTTCMRYFHGSQGFPFILLVSISSRMISSRVSADETLLVSIPPRLYRAIGVHHLAPHATAGFLGFFTCHNLATEWNLINSRLRLCLLFQTSAMKSLW